MAVNCDPSSLANAARCFGSCGKGPIDQSIKTYLLCQISNTGGVVTGPTNFDLADSSTFNNVTLVWTNPTPAGTNNQVWKSTNGGAFVLYATLGGGATTYHDPVALAGAGDFFTYKVRSVQGTVPSAFTATRSACRSILKTGAADASLSYPDLVFQLSNGGAGLFFDNMPNLTSFSAPLLRRVDDQFNFTGSALLSSVSLPVLDNVGETGSDNFFFDNCTGLTSLSLPALKKVGSGGGNFHLTGCTALVTVSLPVFTAAGGDFLFNNCTALTSISCPSLATVSESLSGSGNTVMTTASFPALLTVGTDFNFNNDANLTTLSAPLLNDIAGSSDLSHNPKLTSLTLTSLQSVGFVFTLANDGLLQVISLPALTFIGDIFVANLCSNLTTLSFPAGVAFQNDVQVSDCPSLATLNLAGATFLNATQILFNNDAIVAGSSPAGTGVNGILARGVASGVTTDFFSVVGGVSAGFAALSAQGHADFTTLTTAGNTVNLNP